MGKRFITVCALLILMGVPAQATRFYDIGTTLNLASTVGAAWGDYDNDGYPDLYLDAIANTHRAYLLHNNGNGTFSDVTIAMGLRTEATAWDDAGVAWGDFNNDGRLDLIVAGGGGHLPFLYRNDGDHFTDIGGAVAGFSDQWYTGRGVAWGDYDGDNWLDLYVANDHWGGPAYLYKNNRDGTFTEVTSAAGMDLAPATYSQDAAWVDYDNDGLLDLVVSRSQDAGGYEQNSRLYHNDGDGTFTDLSLGAGFPNGSASGIAVGDYDNDGFFDLYFDGNQNRASHLLHNRGDGTFTDVYGTAMGGVSANGTGVCWGDYDNDGYLDLAQGNNTEPDYNWAWPVQAFLFHNDHSGTFTEVSQGEGVTATRHFKAAAWADFNRDGKLDLLLAGDDAYSCLYQNTGGSADGNWLRVRALTSATGDATSGGPVRDAIGARLDVNLDNDTSFSTGRTLTRIIDGGSGWVSQGEQVAHFGLGTATKVAVRVIFPDHSTVKQANVTANQQLVIREAKQSMGSLQGTVTGENGAALIGAKLTCGPYLVFSDVNGRYRFWALPTGVWSVTVSKAPLGPKHVVVLINAGQTTITDISFAQTAGGTLSGTVTNQADGYPVTGACVSASGLATFTDQNGGYRLANILPGTLPVGVSASSYYWSAPATVTLAEGQTLTRDFVLEQLPTLPEVSFAPAPQTFPSALGAAWGDYDGDGLADLFLTGNNQDPYKVRLFRNNGSLTFTDASAQAGLPSTSDLNDGVAWADYDNDGLLDVVVGGDGGVNNQLYHNAGGVFSDVATAEGLSSTKAARSASWCDYDGDNWLDLFLCYMEPADRGGSRLYHNNEDGSFTDVTDAVGLSGAASPEWADSCAWADYDGDGRPDFFATRAGRLYHNNGDGTFTDVTAASQMSITNGSSAAWGDYDNDGYFDLYVTREGTGRGWLYHNNGEGTFTDVTAAAGLGNDAQDSRALVWFDYDNDGWLDLYVTSNQFGSGLLLYHNNGNGTFTEVGAGSGLITGWSNNGAAAVADVDVDGALDLLQTFHTADSTVLYHNQAARGHWLRVHALTGAMGDATGGGAVRDALGARVEVNVDDDPTFPPYRTLVRLIDGGSGFLSQNEPVAQFGLPVPGPVSVRVLFPDGSIVTHRHVAVNGQETLRDVPADRVSHFSDVPLDYWAVTSIESCVQAGVVAGYPDGTYAPTLDIDRAQMAVFIARALVGGETHVPTNAVQADFTDVPTSYWAFRHIEYLYAQGMVQGYGNGMYLPEAPLDRAQMAVFIARAMCGGGDSNVPAFVGTASFADVPAGFWALKHVEYMKQHNVTQGYPDGLYHPEYVCTRDQMAVFVQRAFGLQ